MVEAFDFFFFYRLKPVNEKRIKTLAFWEFSSTSVEMNMKRMPI